MKKYLIVMIGVVLAVQSAAAEELSLTYGRFGTVAVYRQTPHPTRVALFVSGDGGWNQGVVDMARQLAGLDALVAGIDIVHYLKQLADSGEACSYPAADFENLSHFLQKKLDFPDYIQPVLIGYSSGATLVYATLVQAPPGTFSGAISLGFCPDLPLVNPFCTGSGFKMEPGPKGKGVNFLPASHLENPWIALQGDVDQVCDPTATRRFVDQVAKGEIVMLPKVGHGYSVPRNWMPQFRQAFLKIVGRQVADTGGIDGTLSDLPLVEVQPVGKQSRTMAVIVTGDGGWAGVDRELAAGLADRGIGVVGLNSLKYFWTPRTPQQLGSDMDRILSHYMKSWRKEQAVLIGYSLGADVLPFAVNRLPESLRALVRCVVLLAPGRQTSFEFHLSNWIGGPSSDTFAVQPEIERISGPSLLCLYGAQDKESVCPLLAEGSAQIEELKGGHHFGGDYGALVQKIIARTEP
ncbi:virulence protein [Desulfosarcina widdelii]|uniref:Virulence protein n=1 Tax=Desulfosarcina widdelii TaxID=947919 RepID=A0A5K7Z4E1_9BACT|nr:AcvB/VirJ family lysyl-phosphatidylglycerol hydrolase [Desulfosarcina widdelii]BBO75595.1 virulence protein [Desulfosarcina widdelii]